MSDRSGSDEAAGDDPGGVLLAGEYVLGVLTADEAKACADRRLQDPGFDAVVAGWERQLMPLTALVPAVPPPPGLRARIEAAMAMGTGVPARARAGRRELWFWRGATGASLVLAGVLAALLLVRTAPVDRVAALLPPGGDVGGYAVELADGRYRLDPLRAPTLPAGRDLQLWTLAPGTTTPQSLGVLPIGGVALPPGAVPPGAVQLLVSLEPTGGSPTGLPTGPVVLAAQLPGGR